MKPNSTNKGYLQFFLLLFAFMELESEEKQAYIFYMVKCFLPLLVVPFCVFLR